MENELNEFVCNNCLVDPCCKNVCSRYKEFEITKKHLEEVFSTSIRKIRFMDSEKVIKISSSITVEGRESHLVWTKNGERHREGGPAVEHSDGSKAWWINGKRHREGGPAVEYPNGSKSWWRNGKIHRKDGPSYEDSNGSKEWWRNGKRVK
jgi:hypothetical protein